MPEILSRSARFLTRASLGILNMPVKAIDFASSLVISPLFLSRSIREMPVFQRAWEAFCRDQRQNLSLFDRTYGGILAPIVVEMIESIPTIRRFNEWLFQTQPRPNQVAPAPHPLVQATIVTSPGEEGIDAGFAVDLRSNHKPTTTPQATSANRNFANRNSGNGINI